MPTAPTRLRSAAAIWPGLRTRQPRPAAWLRVRSAGSAGHAAAPGGAAVAVAAQDGRLFVVDVAAGSVRELAASANGQITGLAWSPDSAWLAWSQPADHPGGMGGNPLRRLRLGRIAAAR